MARLGAGALAIAAVTIVGPPVSAVPTTRLVLRPAAESARLNDQRGPSPSDARLRASILTARDDLLRGYRDGPVDRAQAAFRSFWRFYDETVRDLSSRFQSGPFDHDLLQEISAVQTCLERPLALLDRSRDPRMARLKTTHAAELRELREWRRCGFDFSWGEGDWYLRDDPEFIAAVAVQLPLGELGDYVAFYAREARQRLAEDAGFVVGWDEIRKRLVRWEEFAVRHPALPETAAEVQPEVNRILDWYLFGIDNSPAYDWRGGSGAVHSLRLDPRLRASYERFIRENKTSSFHSLITGVDAILQRHDYSPDTELLAFLRSRLAGPEHRLWLDGFERRIKER